MYSFIGKKCFFLSPNYRVKRDEWRQTIIDCIVNVDVQYRSDNLSIDVSIGFDMAFNVV